MAIRKHLHSPRLTDADRKPYKNWSRDEFIAHVEYYASELEKAQTRNTVLATQIAEWQRTSAEENRLKGDVESARLTLKNTEAQVDSYKKLANENYEALEHA